MSWGDMNGICDECGEQRELRKTRDFSGYSIYLCRKCYTNGRSRYRDPRRKRKYIYQLLVGGSVYGHFPTKKSAESQIRVLRKGLYSGYPAMMFMIRKIFTE